MDYLHNEFAYARSQGWVKDFVQAGKDYEFDPALLMAIASRETNMRNIIGDGGHGYGLMQIDVRSFPDFCHGGGWRNPALSIHMGAQVLDSKRTQIEHLQGMTNHLGGYTFVGAPIAGADLLHAAVAAYNCGLWAYYCFSKKESVDRLTTGHNYSADVMKRAAEFTALMKEK